MKKFQWILTGVALAATLALSAIAWSARVAVDNSVTRGVSDVREQVSGIKVSIENLGRQMDRHESGKHNGTASKDRVDRIENRLDRIERRRR